MKKINIKIIGDNNKPIRMKAIKKGDEFEIVTKAKGINKRTKINEKSMMININAKESTLALSKIDDDE